MKNKKTMEQMRKDFAKGMPEAFKAMKEDIGTTAQINAITAWDAWKKAYDYLGLYKLEDYENDKILYRR